MITYGNTCPAIDDGGLCGLPLHESEEFCDVHAAARKRTRPDSWPVAVIDAGDAHRRALIEADRASNGGSILAQATRESTARERAVLAENSDAARLRAARREV